ncbi:hypothetical protein NSA19_13435, partial [Actinomyces bowdenii]|nr:hypothetical protein [Actinomyces bowdenii]
MSSTLAGAASAILLAAGAVILPASPASAAERDGVCDVGEVCFHFNSGQKWGEWCFSDRGGFSSSFDSIGWSHVKG